MLLICILALVQAYTLYDEQYIGNKWFIAEIHGGSIAPSFQEPGNFGSTGVSVGSALWQFGDSGNSLLGRNLSTGVVVSTINISAAVVSTIAYMDVVLIEGPTNSLFIFATPEWDGSSGETLSFISDVM